MVASITGRLTRISLLAVVVLSALPAMVSAGGGSVNVSVVVPIVPWNKIIYPEGVYEPYVTGQPGTHLYAFNLTFLNFTSVSGSRLSCQIRRSDNTLFALNKTLGDSKNVVERMMYTLASNDPVNKHTPWKVENCSLISPQGQVVYATNSSYDSPLGKRIMVHSGAWTRFSSIDDDGYLAQECFNEVPKRYFNNSVKCDFTGDIAFAVAMSRGMRIEGGCHDGVDGADGNGDLDCSDIYCQGVPYSCAPHKYVGDPFTGICRNGLCWETKKVAGKDVTYWYTRYLRPGGALKIRFNISDYSTSKTVSYAIAGLAGYSSRGSYTMRGSHKPSKESSTKTSYALEDSAGYYGSMDFVMYVVPTGMKPGWNTFSIYIVHYGKDLLIEGIPYYVGNEAPSNWNEGESMGPSIVEPCGDGFDNDLNYAVDCRDSGCDGEKTGLDCSKKDAYCNYGMEEECRDCFDNDGDGVVDCRDSNCDEKPGNYYNSKDVCEFGCEGCGDNYPSNCQDGFDNDGNNLTDCYDQNCRVQGQESENPPCPAYENAKAEWCADGQDNDFDGRTDCADYDCAKVKVAGTYTCPQNEAYDANGNNRLEQCFDGVDNDLDSPEKKYYGPGPMIDCADPDCAGAVNPKNPRQECSKTEYDPTVGINLCSNGIDDDGDDYVDCQDRDCWHMFDLCGPCPASEDYRYNSCANRLDDDFDWFYEAGTVNCEDADCLGDFSSLNATARCEGRESSCGDGFDNDADGLTDCADQDCIGRMGPGGVCARNESTAALCSDDFDNDGDGVMDCIDPDCWIASGSGCSPKFWNGTSTFEVPYITPLASINQTLVQYSHTERLHVNDSYSIRFRASGSYGAVVITLGDATNPGMYFPYNASSCTMTGTPYLKWISTQSEVGQIQHKPTYVGPGKPLSGFDVTLTCSKAAVAGIKSYPVSVTNLLSGAPELGETVLTSTSYNVSAPAVVKLEVEPMSSGKVNIRYGGYFDLRAVPSADVLSVSQCYFNVSSRIYVTPNDCVLRYSPITDDQIVPVTAAIEDGGGNLGPYGAYRELQVNVLPSMTAFNLTRVFRKPGEALPYQLGFRTASSGQMKRTCTVKVYDQGGAEVKVDFPEGIILGNTLDCSSNMETAGLADGLYFAEASASDEDDDTAYAGMRRFYVCGSFDSRGEGWDCSQADFDMDDIPDICILNGSISTTTTLFNYTATTLVPENISSCSTICEDNYKTLMYSCSPDITCSIPGAEWMWTHDDRGDISCWLADKASNYCCCQLEGIPPTTTLMSMLSPICYNGVKDQGEWDVDCGGPCRPCDICYNGMLDDGEEGVDCGGPCLQCASMEGINSQEAAQLYIVGVPAYVSEGDIVRFTVANGLGQGVQTYLEYALPNGSKMRSVTDPSGKAYMTSSIAGLWSLEAKRTGYFPATAVWATLPATTLPVTVTATVSLLLPLIAALAAAVAWRRYRKGYAATEGALKALLTAGDLETYSPVLVTDETYRKSIELRKHLRTLRLSDLEAYEADKLAQEHDLKPELARLIVLARKARAAKVLTETEAQITDYHRTKIILVWSELKEKVT